MEKFSVRSAAQRWAFRRPVEKVSTEPGMRLTERQYFEADQEGNGVRLRLS